MRGMLKSRLSISWRSSKCIASHAGIPQMNPSVMEWAKKTKSHLHPANFVPFSSPSLSDSKRLKPCVMERTVRSQVEIARVGSEGINMWRQLLPNGCDVGGIACEIDALSLRVDDVLHAL